MSSALLCFKFRSLLIKFQKAPLQFYFLYSLVLSYHKLFPNPGLFFVVIRVSLHTCTAVCHGACHTGLGPGSLRVGICSPEPNTVLIPGSCSKMLTDRIEGKEIKIGSSTIKSVSIFVKTTHIQGIYDKKNTVNVEIKKNLLQ